MKKFISGDVRKVMKNIVEKQIEDEKKWLQLYPILEKLKNDGCIVKIENNLRKVGQFYDPVWCCTIYDECCEGDYLSETILECFKKFQLKQKLKML